MTRYMLDTNMVSFAMRGRPAVLAAASKHGFEKCCVSAITEGELRYGLARNAGARNLPQLIDDFMLRFEVLPWTSLTARRYGLLRARFDAIGRRLAPLDMLIAAHALEADAVLVTNDRAFGQVEGLMVEDWVG